MWRLGHACAACTFSRMSLRRSRFDPQRLPQQCSPRSLNNSAQGCAFFFFFLVPNRATLIDYAQPPDASVLLTKTLCIDFLTDTLVRQLDTQAENIKQVKELLIQVNNKLRDKDSITVSVVRTSCETFQSHPLVVEERTHRVSKSTGPLSSPAHPQTRAVDVGQAHTWRAG